jgi:hypothetical protein
MGIIDRIKSGSAKKHDFALYRLSDRWRNFGKQTFEATPWPKSTTIGARGEGGRFLRTRGRKSPVVAIPATTKAHPVAIPATTTPPVVVKSAMRACGKPRSVVAESAMLLSAPSLDVDSKKILEGSGGIAAPTPKRLRFTKPKVLECQLTPAQRDDFLREVANVRTWT